MKRAVFLDRDGVINRPIVKDGIPYPPSDLSELDIPDDVPQALGQLREFGFRLIVVSNQPDVARGVQSEEAVLAINSALQDRLAIDEFRVCFHDDGDNCACRKPLPGMLLEAAAGKDIDLAASFMIGDRWRDVEAGKRAGCGTILIDHGYDERFESEPDRVVKSLSEAAQWILSQQQEGDNEVVG